RDRRREAGNDGLHRARQQDHDDADGALLLASGARRRAQVRHGARHGAKLRPPRGSAGVAPAARCRIGAHSQHNAASHQLSRRTPMSAQMAAVREWPRGWRSAAALLPGFLAVVVLSLGTDQVLHALDVYPPWGEPMHSTSLNLLALTYRTVYAVVGSYVAARLAPDRPMAHAL